MAHNIKLSDLQIELHRMAVNNGIALLDLRPAADLRKAAMRLQSLNEQACNGVQRWNEKHKRVLAEWNDSDQTRNDSATDRARGKAIAAMAEIFGDTWSEKFDLEFQRDPRGAAIKIHRKGESGFGAMVAVY